MSLIGATHFEDRAKFELIFAQFALGQCPADAQAVQTASQLCHADAGELEPVHLVRLAARTGRLHLKVDRANVAVPLAGGGRLLSIATLRGRIVRVLCPQVGYE